VAKAGGDGPDTPLARIPGRVLLETAGMSGYIREPPARSPVGDRQVDRSPDGRLPMARVDLSLEHRVERSRANAVRTLRTRALLALGRDLESPG
jgi:hypothetical protein